MEQVSSARGSDGNPHRNTHCETGSDVVEGLRVRQAGFPWPRDLLQVASPPVKGQGWLGGLSAFIYLKGSVQGLAYTLLVVMMVTVTFLDQGFSILTVF